VKYLQAKDQLLRKELSEKLFFNIEYFNILERHVPNMQHQIRPNDNGAI
jgi:hypothetical protein